MRFKKLLFNVAVVAVSAFNVYLVNDIRIMKNELSLLNLENIAESNEIMFSEGSVYTTGGIFPSATYVETEPMWVDVPNSGSGSHWVYAIVYYIFLDCNGESNKPCSPYTRRGYTIIPHTPYNGEN